MLGAHRKAWVAAASVAVVIWFCFWLLLRALPGDQSWSTAAFAGAIAMMFVMFRRMPPGAIVSWEGGALGEE